MLPGGGNTSIVQMEANADTAVLLADRFAARGGSSVQFNIGSTISHTHVSGGTYIGNMTGGENTMNAGTGGQVDEKVLSPIYLRSA